MKIDVQNATLIIAGSWNPAILNDPNWFGRSILELPPGQNFNMNLEMAVAEQSIRKLSFLGISFIASPQALVFFIDPTDAESGNRAISTARKVLEVLMHTPVSGIGFNFQFLLENPRPEFMNRFHIGADLEDAVPNQQIVGMSWGNIIKDEAKLITVRCESQSNNGSITLNIHDAVGSAHQALEVLNSGAFGAIFQKARGIAEILSNEPLEENA